MNKTNNVQNIDCFEGMKSITDNSVDLILTDPPYFIKGMGDDWDKEKLSKRCKKATVGSLPSGMKFDINQGRKFYEFSLKLSKEYLRVLKPGGFCLSFSQARLYHNMTFAFEESGFEIRDMLGWTYTGQAKAQNLDRFVKSNKNFNSKEKEKLLKSINGRKTPQLAPNIESICLAQKPKEGNFVENWFKHQTGLIDTSNFWNDKFPGNLIPCAKPSKKEKLDINDHISVKPIKMIEHLIKVFSKKNDVVLDPFLGSGTTLLAATNQNRSFIGFEINKDYYKIINKRFEEIGGILNG